MTALILGPNGSGKSAYAEKLAVRLSSARARDGSHFPCSGTQAGALYYIATMLPYGNEGRLRIEKHRRQREPMGFITVEKPFNVSEIQLPPDAIALLEDVSNLLSNAMFDIRHIESRESVFTDIAVLCAKCRDLVIVSIDGLAAQQDYSGETNDYIRSLDSLNRKLFDMADMVAQMRGGEAVVVKEVCS